jgi:hypothetical protein
MKKFFRSSDAGLLFLLSLFNIAPLMAIAKLQGYPPDFLHLCFVIFRSFLYSATCVLVFAWLRASWKDDQQDEKAQLQKEEKE